MDIEIQNIIDETRQISARANDMSDYSAVLIEALKNYFESCRFPQQKAAGGKKNLARDFADLCDAQIRMSGVPWDSSDKSRKCYKRLWKLVANIELKDRYSLSFEDFAQIRESYIHEPDSDLKKAFIQNLVQALSSDIWQEVNQFVDKHVYDRARATSTLRKTVEMLVENDLSRFVFPEEAEDSKAQNTAEFMLRVVMPTVKRNFYKEWETRYPKQKLSIVADEDGTLMDSQISESHEMDNLIACDMVAALFELIEQACEAGRLKPKDKMLLTLYYGTEGNYSQMAQILAEMEGNPDLSAKNIMDRAGRLFVKLREFSILKGLK